MNRLLSGIKGFLIGAANVVPGVSSGTLMVIFDIYDRFVEAANLFFRHPIKAILSILDILIGIFFGIIGTFLLVSYTYETFPLAITFLILGIVLGGFKPIIDKIKGKSSPLNIIILIISMAIVIGLPLITQRESVHSGAAYYIILVLLGFVAAFAAIAPGISGSLILLIFGYYYHILDTGKSAFELIIKGNFKESLSYILPLFIFIVCAIVGAIISVKLIKKIMDKYETPFYFSVMGMLIGSPFAILILLNKQIEISSISLPQQLISILLLFGGYFLIYFLLKIEKKKNLKLKEKNIEDKNKEV